MSKESKFWDKLAYKYSLSPIPDQQIYEKKLSLTQKYLKPEMSILEFGCGTGGTALIHSSYVKHIKAIDFSENMIKIARQKAQDKNIQNVSFECADIEDFDDQKEKFDVILGLNVLHLVEDKERIIRKVFSLLKSGGYFVTSTACLNDSRLLRLLKYVAPLGYRLGKLPLVRFFSEKDLVFCHEKIGFRTEHIWTPKKGSSFLIAKK